MCTQTMPLERSWVSRTRTRLYIGQEAMTGGTVDTAEAHTVDNPRHVLCPTLAVFARGGVLHVFFFLQELLS